MRHAIRQSEVPTREIQNDATEDAAVLDGEEVLACLETDSYGEHRGDPVTGIFYGLMIGAAIWTGLIAVVGILFW